MELYRGGHPTDSKPAFHLPKQDNLNENKRFPTMQ